QRRCSHEHATRPGQVRGVQPLRARRLLGVRIGGCHMSIDAAAVGVEELAPGIWAWRAPHPEGRTHREHVVSYALAHEGGLAIVDGLLPPDRGAQVVDALDELARRGRSAPLLFVTIPYHVRSADALAARWPGARVIGPERTARRLAKTTAFVAIAA